MTDATDNRLIAAHLTAALIAKLSIEGLPALHAVNLFNEVLDELGKERPSKAAATSPLHFYGSSNGDIWSLVYDANSGRPSVMHQPNAESGGKASSIDVDQFLRESPSGPQHAALKVKMQAEGNAGSTPRSL